MSNESAMRRLTSFIRERRTELDLTQIEFAKLTGMTQSWVARFELNKYNNVNPDNIASLERALGLSENYLYLVMGGFASVADLFVSSEIHPIMRLIAEARVESISIQQVQNLVEVQRALKQLGRDLTPTMIADLLK